MAVSVMGLLLVLSSWLGNRNVNTGQTQPANAQTSPNADKTAAKAV